MLFWFTTQLSIERPTIGGVRIDPLLTIALVLPLFVGAGVGYYRGMSRIESAKLGAVSGAILAILAVVGGLVYAVGFVGLELSNVPFFLVIGTVWLLLVGLYGVTLGTIGGVVGEYIARRPQ
jgi:hypothetical protein